MTYLCSANITSGIKNIVIKCGCDYVEACLSVDVKDTELKEKIKVCGSTIEPVFIVGHEITMSGTDKLDIFDGNEECLLKGTLSIESSKAGGGVTYANYHDAVFSYMGVTPSVGAWIHKYKVSARSMTLSDKLPEAKVALSYEGCYLSLDSECDLESVSFEVIVDGTPQATVITNSMGDLINATTGVIYGTPDKFMLPFSSFELQGTAMSQGSAVTFSVETSGQCPVIMIVIDGATTIEVEAYPTSAYTVEYSNYASNTYTSNDYVGTNTLSFVGRGAISITGCGVFGLDIDGGAISVDLGNACVTALDVGDAPNLAILHGGIVTDYTGNGEAIPPCDWPLITYTDHYLTGYQDLTCYTVLEEVDFSSSTVTGFDGSDTILRIDLSYNTVMDDSNLSFCKFPNLELLAVNGCPVTTIDISCAPQLQELYANSCPSFTDLITGGVHTGLEVLEMSGSGNTESHHTKIAFNLPSLRVLHWSYNGISDLIQIHAHPVIEEFFCDNCDPNPFWFSFGSSDFATIRKFTYINSTLVSSDTNLLLSRPATGGMNNCDVVVDVGNAPPNSSACGHISTLISNSCTVAYPSGGAC